MHTEGMEDIGKVVEVGPGSRPGHALKEVLHQGLPIEGYYLGHLGRRGNEGEEQEEVGGGGGHGVLLRELQGSKTCNRDRNRM